MIRINICLDLLSEKNLKKFFVSICKDFKNMQEIEITRWLFSSFSEYTYELY
jgi:hypothetical protein